MVLYRCSMSLSLSLSAASPRSLKTLELCTFNWFFHFVIRFGWTSCFLLNSLNVSLSCNASMATFTLNSAVNFRRLIVFVLVIFFSLSFVQR